MWRTVAASVAGASHRRCELGCDDAHHVEVAPEGTLLLAVADGAGSAARGAAGSWWAVRSAFEVLRAGCASGGEPALVVALALAHARRCVLEVARTAGCPPSDLATTLAVVMVGDDGVAAAQVGDGAVVVCSGAALTVLAAGARGEYRNETCFLTSGAWASEARVQVLEGVCVDAVAALTDGLEIVAFDLASGTAHPGFFQPLCRWAGEADVNTAGAELAAFLGSPRVSERTDDDTTLVLAVRA